ncbi:type II toxin-antitoxin system VapB family antitoxin [Kineococcus sp. G2]|uniref:type II toxin-antitoxin system VapB family antitoxin n=1 Tax=Kineococcus sp. G2 TaxID=3127484 RepID=UPI00301DE0D0
MSKTHIDIDDDLLAQVAAITGTTTKRDTVDTALRTTLRHERRRRTPHHPRRERLLRPPPPRAPETHR